MHSIWEGSLSFGLVNLPVRLYSATAGTELDLDLLHKTDLSPIRYARVCREDGKEVPYEEVVKGYQYKKGDYVVLTEEDFKKADVRRSQIIDVISFVKEDEIDIVFAEKPYYLEPDRGSEKAYVILREALKKSGKVAVARFVLRDREHLGIVKPMDTALVLNQIRFQDELKTVLDLNIPKREVREKEINMALELINHLTEHFDPKDFHDTYKKEIKDVIIQKAKGLKPRAKGKAPETTKSRDLMKALKASLEEAKRGRQHLYAS